jgi:MOSC N-terminal beta barrel domain
MEGQPIGVVKDLFRYPVKSMQGERLNAVEIVAQGVSATVPTHCVRPTAVS